MAIVYTFTLSFLTSLLAVWGVRTLARKHGWYDRQSERKIHTGTIPRIGGAGIFIGFVVTFFALTILPRGLFPHLEGTLHFWPIALAGTFLFLLGFIDDFISLRARHKFLIEIMAASFVVAMGYRFRTIELPFSFIFDLGWFSYPLTVFWLVGVTNALNLIDGMDGLSSTVSCFVAATFAIFFYVTGDYASTILCCVLFGAVGGFFAFNKPKASIFMGDGGALFLGFVLAVLPLLNQASGGRAELGLVSAITALLIPIYDTFSAILRRQRAHVSFFMPDRGHLHHKLLDMGLSTWQVLAVIALANAVLAVAALSSLYLPADWAFVAKIGSWGLFLGLFLVLHYDKERRLKDPARAAK
jgi:UDP-N-acetylmuramyl pentapeptide phosphotransferase/UDP-N-acetylglucosamine-1-phosphate transferase